MNKLKKKIFWVLFLILTAFVLGTLIVFNINNYKDVERRVKDSFGLMDDRPKLGRKIHEQPDIRFADIKVYTVTYENENIINITSHFFNSDSDDEIKKIATEILKNRKSDRYIGNLYFDRYSYDISSNTMVIIDNHSVNKILIDNVIHSIIIFISLEIVFIIISKELTSWITKPVDEAFQKQKEFIADASHELKTPLSIIIASNEALEKKYDIKYIENIKNESERMNKLILSLLDLAKSESKNRQYVKENLSKIVEKSVLTFESIVYEKGIKLNYDIEKNIVFYCDMNEMKQLIAILLDNAIKHTKESDDVFVGLSSKKNNIEIIVKNKGKEIVQEDQEKIFERFYKVDKSRNRKSGGYGLGLAIAKNIVNKHGGIINASSSNGYTSFRITFKNNN